VDVRPSRPMKMRTGESQQDEPRTRFERPLDVTVMTIDGTWRGEGRLIGISDSGAEIELTGHADGSLPAIHLFYFEQLPPK
jgi:hypothetical protein